MSEQIYELLHFIKLTKGQVAIVDEEDADLALLNWYCANGYAVRRTPGDNGKLIWMHRVILARILRRELRPGEQVDHINGDKTDNRRENLRLATNAQNGANKSKQKGTSSEYKGVCWHKATKKWRAQIGVDWKLIHLGYFTDEMDAASAYDEAAMEYFGEFAKLNFPIEEEGYAS